MGDLPRVRLTPSQAIRRPSGSGPSIASPSIPAISTLVGVAGGLVSVAALVICAVLAVVFAATLAVVMVLASLLLAMAGLAWRLQSRPSSRRVANRPRSGHAWVAYDWNRHPG